MVLVGWYSIEEGVVYIELKGKHCGGYFVPTSWAYRSQKVIGSRGFICPHIVKARDVALVKTRR